MAKCIYICSRRILSLQIEKRLYEICKRLEPDNVSPNEPRVVVNEDVAFGIMNPTKTLLVNSNSLLVGQIFGNSEKWDIPLEEFPDGSYALFRDGKEYFEIVSDPVASRSIWYYMDEDVFISSTSQRAIIMYLHSFQFDERVIPWMLSTGSLGPDFSWDKRIKRVPVDSSVILNKKEWIISTRSNPVEFCLVERSDEEHKDLLLKSIKTTFESLNLDYASWALPLSGGYDSRGILCFLQNTKSNTQNMRTLTWGLESSQGLKGNDATVANELANKFKLPHKYYKTDISGEPIDLIFDRFALFGEGRTDNLQGYMDGFGVWKTIFEDGIEGIIRGDEGFGCKYYTSPLIVRLNELCSLCTDFSNLKDYKKYGFPIQELPQHLKQIKGESLNVWKDRIFHEHTLPTEFSAMSDLKLSFVEVINPLLSKIILKQIRQLPDHLRNEKTLFKQIVLSLSPEIDFASSAAVSSDIDILKQKEIVHFLKKELLQDDAKSVLPIDFLDFVLRGLKYEDSDKRFMNNSFSHKFAFNFKRIIPKFIKEAIRSKIFLPSIDDHVLAFRALLIVKMNKVFKEDSLSK